jgi:hypothetical protein
MKKTLLTVAVIFMVAAVAYGGEKTANVWERPTKKGQGTVPAYRVKQMLNGDVRVYKYGDPFQYQYRIEPDGKVYKYGDPFQPVGDIKNGLPSKDKKGE